MKSLLKLYRYHLLAVILISLTYVITRLINLTAIPIFTDEAIYLRWSQIGSYDAAWRFIPLTDGKPPLYHWFVMLTIRLFSDPLFAGRIVSVIFGFLSLIGISLLGYYLTRSKTVGFLSALMYLSSPFMMVYDRLAIVDCLLTTVSIYSFLLSVLLLKTLRLDVAFMLGGAIGAGLLTKASGLIFLLLSPLSLILSNLKKPPFSSRNLKFFATYSSLFIVVFIISQSVYSILRLSQFFYRIGQKNSEFIISFTEFIEQPFALTFGNAKSLFNWQLGYLTLPIFFLLIFSFTQKRFIREKILLLLYYLLPFFMIATFNKIIFPRFLLFSTPFLLILASIGLFQLIQKSSLTKYKFIIIAAFLLIPMSVTTTLALAPLQADIPQADRDQYLDSWPAGWGINETVSYLKNQADQEPIFIGTQGTFGLMPYALEIYLWRHPNVEIQSYWPVDKIPEEVALKSAEKTTYFIYNELEDIPPQDNLELIMEFKKQRLDEVRHMRLFRVNPSL